jgi:hypothetical protein
MIFCTRRGIDCSVFGTKGLGWSVEEMDMWVYSAIIQEWGNLLTRGEGDSVPSNKLSVLSILSQLR